jgi:23S rRNA (guanosine2251-2'-O)-methyltransferase
MNIEKLALERLNRPALDEYVKSQKLGYNIVADNLRSGQNIGSLFRTADAFACDNIYLTGISPIPPNKEVLKTALGATESVAWNYMEFNTDLITRLKADGVKIVVIEQTTHSIPLHEFIPSHEERYAIVLGNEVDGVSDDFIKNADLCIEIPQVGIKHSLNVSVCAGIVMWHMFSKLKLT